MTIETSGEVLKPCPFCLSIDIHILESGVWTGRENTVTHCEINHHCAGHFGINIKVREKTRESCATTWNKRAEP